MQILTVVLGALAGGVSGLLAPWVKWQIERRRDERRRRHDMVELWRLGLSAYMRNDDRGPIQNEGWYLSLARHLTPAEKRITDPASRTLIVGRDDALHPPEIEAARDAIERIAAEWDVI